MDSKNIRLIENGVLVGFILLIAVLTFLLFEPFLMTILTAGVLAYVTYPLYKKLTTSVKYKYLSAALMIVFVFLVVAIPVILIGGVILTESISGLNSMSEFAKSGITDILNGECSSSSTALCTFTDQIRELADSSLVENYLNGNGISDFSGSVGSILGSGLKSGSGIFKSVTGGVVHFFIMLFTLFFFFTDGEVIAHKIVDAVPLQKRYKTMIVKRFKDTTSGVLYGQLLTSMIQGVVASIGFYIFQINSPIFFGVLIAFTSMIPFVGAIGVWAPLAIIKIVTSLINNDLTGVWFGAGLVVYGTLVISTIDNVVKPKFIGDKAQIHPLLAFIGVLGGISMFGLIGILFGPLIMALFISVFEIYSNNIKKLK